MKKGFTIIELLIVVAIICVSSAIVLVNVQEYIKKNNREEIGESRIKGN